MGNITAILKKFITSFLVGLVMMAIVSVMMLSFILPLIIHIFTGSIMLSLLGLIPFILLLGLMILNEE